MASSGGLNPEASSYLIPVKSAGGKSKRMTQVGGRRRQRKSKVVAAPQLGAGKRRPTVYEGSTQSVRSELALFDLLPTDAMFNNSEIYINGQLVMDTSNFYPWLGYMQRLLSASSIEKNGKLKNELWYPNTVQESYVASDGGWNTRFEMSKGSQTFEMVGQILGNMFTQPRYVVAGTQIRIVLRRAKPELCLESAITKMTGVIYFKSTHYELEWPEGIDLILLNAASDIVNKKITYLENGSGWNIKNIATFEIKMANISLFGHSVGNIFQCLFPGGKEL
ncbi:unnamed protein product [Allacma fusca]|uniref:Uncharacterized protein n=1 Tax=Allacma fusca TaxID=39272 RepID=A0A8J2LAD2_9HEXA|nr:unnamed protein product [Allacma fusca]